MIKIIFDFCEASEYSSFQLLRVPADISVTTENEKAIPNIKSYDKIRGDNRDTVQGTSPETNQTDMHVSVPV